MKRSGYVALISITVYLAVLYDSRAIIFLAGVELLLPLFLFLPLVVGNFLLWLDFVDKNCFLEAGEEAFLGLRLKKRGILPLRQIRFLLAGRNETTGEKYRKWVSLEVERGENIYQKISLGELGYGAWHFSMKRLWVYDYIRLFRLPHSRAKDAVCVILPQKYPISVLKRTDGAGEQEDLASARKMSWEYDRSEREDLREYRPGDALNEIHWKLSARRDELVVWEPQRQKKGGWILGLDFAGWTREKAELVYSLMEGLCQSLGSGTVIFRAGGQEQKLLTEDGDSLYWGMKALLECRPQPMGEEEFLQHGQVPQTGQAAGETARNILWVREPLSLWQGERRLWEIDGLDLWKMPEDMELRL